MRYAELHCLSNFSFLQGASHPEELATQAAELGYAAIAITDQNSVAGVVRAHAAAKDAGLKLLIGAEMTPQDAPPVVLWATNRNGYGELCHLITKGRRRAPKGDCQLTFDDIAQHHTDLLAGILPSAHAEQIDVARLHQYRDLFGDRCYLLAELFRGPHDGKRLAWLRGLELQTSIPLVASGGVLFHTPTRRMLHDVITAVRYRTSVAQAGHLLQPNRERHLRSLGDLNILYQGHEELLARTQEVADQCTFSLDELRYEYPRELAPEGMSPMDYLTQLTWNGAQQRFPEGVPEKVRGLIQHELQLIEELQYEPYFLTVWDLVRFARSRDILCQGRGSAANSVVCYCLGVTSVDPSRIEVLFERFISRERNEAPDIDIDFEHERREEVLQYLYAKYGRERTGMTAVTVTYRPRSAIRDVGKALGLSQDLIDRLAKNAGYHSTGEKFPTRCKEVGLNPASSIGKQFISLATELLGFPRHLSQHTGGMVMTRGPLHCLVPIENAAMEGRTVVQWNKDDLDELGILKVDCLSLGMLTAIRKCFELVKKHHDLDLTLANVPEDDTKVYDMICRADTIGVFQIESRAQMSMLPRLKPRCYYDLVIEVSIVRPGPIQGDMVHPYLRRRNGEEPVTYPNENIKRVLKKTLGVPLFQEQCMQLSIVAAGFTPGEADQLRRAMAAWRRPGLIDQFRRKLLAGMQENGLTGDYAERVFNQIRGFGEYGFPESHAASFALLVYVSSWLKCHYPAEFAASIINSQPMGFYAPAQLIRDARDHHVEVLPIDVNFSDWSCTIENQALRLGFRLISGLRQETVETVVQARAYGPFLTMDEFLVRTQLSRTELARLSDADAFRSLNENRRLSFWNSLAQSDSPTQPSLFSPQHFVDDITPELPQMSAEQEVHADYRTTSFSLRAHPLSFYREELDSLRVIPNGDLRHIANNESVRVAGLVLLRQRPSTAKGITFVTIEDETGAANLVVHQQTWDRYRKITHHSRAWLVHGYVQSKDSVIHVVANRIVDLSDKLHAVQTKSRDFR
ncbi:MAG: error-prone DNA polymerase [Planctomycetaceae bacterium]